MVANSALIEPADAAHYLGLTTSTHREPDQAFCRPATRITGLRCADPPGSVQPFLEIPYEQASCAGSHETQSHR
jgi:hypothetical protein